MLFSFYYIYCASSATRSIFPPPSKFSSFKQSLTYLPYFYSHLLLLSFPKNKYDHLFLWLKSFKDVDPTLSNINMCRNYGIRSNRWEGTSSSLSLMLTLLLGRQLPGVGWPLEELCTISSEKDLQWWWNLPKMEIIYSFWDVVQLPSQ